MSVKLDEKDLAILSLIQADGKLTAKQIAKKTGVPLTTVFAKTKRMEEQGVIRGFRAIVAPDKLRLIKGLEKTLTCMVFETVKETTEVAVSLRKSTKS